MQDDHIFHSNKFHQSQGDFWISKPYTFSKSLMFSNFKMRMFYNLSVLDGELIVQNKWQKWIMIENCYESK